MPKKELNMRQQLLREMLDDSLTKTEVKKALKDIVALIKRVKQKNEDEMKSIDKKLNELVNKYMQDTSSGLDMTKSELKTLIDQEIARVSKEHSNKMEEVDIKMSLVKDGKDADEERVAQTVMSQIQFPTIEDIKKELPKFGESVRNGLELLQGEEKLDINAIRDLREELDKLKEEKKASKKVGGGFSKIAMEGKFIDDEVPSGTVNGTNKVFTLVAAPNPAASLKVFVNGMKMKAGGEDYTLSGKTITFGTAPPTGTNILCDYRK